MNSEPEEINLLLNLVFGIAMVFGLLILGLIYWVLRKTELLRFNKSSYSLNALSSAILSIIGVFVFASIIDFAINIFRFIALIIKE